MFQEQLKSLDDIDDVLIVRKIEIKDPSAETSSTESIRATQCLCFVNGCDCKENDLVEEQEAIIKKQLQILQANERGKEALFSEIAALKERQESRAELLRHRQHALEIEKERARKIAALPPPLPKSIKLLLKENDDKPKLNKPDVQMPDELTAVHITPIEICERKIENKENIIDPEELESKQKKREEWDMKAKKRYNEALKKNRQKEEYSKIMKQIQNAELLNRQEMAKNVSSDKKGMPCPLSDNLQTTRKQVDMEDAAEKIFKRTGTKEHIIEDVEGYQDHYEEKYRQIDSIYEAKMIDCVPSFVKENYNYLLEDESKFLGGKNFSGLDDDSISDILNEAYIEISPGADERHGTREIHTVISHFDRLRSNLEIEYEQNVKPLLAAAFEVPKKESKDQAVETDFVKLPAEDKAVETDEQFKNELTSPSPTATFNFKNAGVMAYKRRPRLPILSTYEAVQLPDMHQRDVYYTFPFIPESKSSAESWSPSTYCSLPTKHGIPSFTDGAKCDICVAEMEKDQIKNNFVQKSTPSSVLFNKEKHINLAASFEKIQLSKLVQQLAEKHLVKKSTESSLQRENSDKSSDNLCSLNHSNTKIVSPAFEKEVIGKSEVGVFNETTKSESISKPVKNIVPEKEKEYNSSLVTENLVSKGETIDRSSETNKEAVKVEKLQDNIYSKMKDNELHKSPNEYSEYDYEAKRIQAIHQVLSRKFPQFLVNNNDKAEGENNEKEAKQAVFTQPDKPYIYHELSTIQEVDSALTSSSLQLSQSKLSNTSERKGEKCVPSKEQLENSSQPSEKIKMISLLDPPDTEIAELAKSIHFIPESEKKVYHNLETLHAACTNSSGNKSITSSKEYLKTPTLTTGSYSSVSISTPSLPLSSSSESVPSTESTQNKDVQSCIISGYISDIEFQGTSESSGVSSPNYYNNIIYSKLKFDDLKRLAAQTSSEKSFRPMTPHSNISLHSDAFEKDLENYRAGSLKSITPHSIVPLSTEFVDHALKRDLKENSVKCFKPMTPYSNVSSPNSLTAYEFVKEQQEEKVGNLKFNPVYSNVSSPSKIPNFVFIKDNQNDNSATNFKVLTPHSNVSSPSTGIIFSLSDECKSYVSTSGSFKALTPHSNITSPSSDAVVPIESVPIDDASSFEKLNNKLSSENSGFKPVILRLDISTDSLTLSTFKNKPSEDKHVSQLNCNLSLKTLLKPANSNLAIQVPRTEITSEVTDNIKHADKSKTKINKRHKGMHLKASKQYALACTSDFFIPSINEDSGSSIENINKGLAKFSTPNNAANKPEIILDEAKTNAEDLKEITEEKSDAESTISDKEISKKPVEKIMVMELKEVGKTKARFENLRNFRQQSSNLQGLSSTSSSTENLSVISHSKVVCQSTPIKNISELLQEPGILEEPDLTLVNTVLSCRGDVTEIHKDPLTSNQVKEPAPKEVNCTEDEFSSENKSKTPISLSPQFLGSSDTPSMLSFLHHEMSCKQAENESVSIQSPAANIPVLQNFQENDTPVRRDVKRSLFQRTGYKERTKRLWSNLEEVKKKKLAEERKKEMQLNRKKAKEFAKKLTPKQRGN